MGYLKLSFALLVCSTSSPGSCACSPPLAPDCVSQPREFGDDYELHECKFAMEFYAASVTQFRSCLREADQKAIDDFDNAVKSFNRRALRSADEAR